MNLFLWKVEAQADEFTSPTIPFDPIGPRPSLGPTPIFSGPTISLSNELTELETGESTRIQITIDTDGQEVTQYTLQILFNSSVVEVVDSNPQLTGTQIDFLDTAFDPSVNEVNQQQGIINIIANNPAGSSTITNRIVAEIEVVGISSGFSEFAFVEENTSLTTSNSVNILQTTNNTAITVDGGGGSPTATPPAQSIIPSQPNTSVNPSLGPTGINVSKTPDTDLPDHLTTPLTLVFGLLLVAVGTYIYKMRNETENQKVHRK